MKVKTITGVGILGALTIVLTVLSNYIQIGEASINLSLVPICLAGILYGPLAGAIVGLINGAIVLTSPSTISFFFPLSFVGTIIICLVKSVAVGLFSAFAYKLIKNKKFGIVLVSLCGPIINTGLFILGAFIFYNNIFATLVTLVLFINFLIEFVASILLIPTSIKLVNLSPQNK